MSEAGRARSRKRGSRTWPLTTMTRGGEVCVAAAADPEDGGEALGIHRVPYEHFYIKACSEHEETTRIL